MSMTMLSENVIPRILSGENVINPRLQVLGYKRVNGDGRPGEDGQMRYRFLLSDGNASHQFCVMMKPDLIQRIERGEFEKYSVIELSSYLLNELNDRKVIVILETRVLHKGRDIKEKIGKPNLPGQANTSIVGPGSRKILPSPMTSPMPPPARRAPINRNVASTSADISELVCGISDLNPYINRWTIKGRITSKTPIKTWSNQKGEGRLFSFDIADETGEIRVTAFKAECDKFFDLIEVGKVYLVSRAIIKQANKKFSQLKNDYELSLISDTVIIPGDDNDSGCPRMSFDFVKIKDIAVKNADSLVDVLGVCKSVGDLQTLTQRSSGRELKKRDISLVDDSETEVKLTLWGDQAEQSLASEGSAVVVKKAKVSDFSGKSLSCTQSSFVQVDPDLPSAFGLKGWYERHRDTLRPQTLSTNTSGQNENFRWINLCEVNLAAIRSEKGVLNFNTIATIVQVGRLQTYMSCTTPGCKKKVTDLNNGYYKCDKCNKNFTEYEPRIIFSVAISDWGGELWISVFHEEAEKMLGISGKELLEMKENNSPEYEEIISSLNFKRYNFRLRSVEDHYKEEVRIKTSASAVNPISTADYGRKLLEKLSLLSI